MLTYLVKVNIALAVFWIVYLLFFGRDTLLSMRRAALWTMAAMAFVYPFITLRTIEIAAMADMLAGGITGGNVVDTTAGAAAPFPWEMLLTGIYLLGVAVLFGRFLVQSVRITVLGIKSRKAEVCGTNVRVTGHPSAPFSFFGWVFIDPAKYSEADLREIIAHERTHAREWHSVDVVFFELLKIVLWVNPFAWLMKDSVCQNLEYLADKDVIRSGSDRRAYQYRLLQLSCRESRSAIANHFSKSQLKKRIAMMNKKHTSPRAAAKYALIVPAVFMLLALSNVKAIAVADPRPPVSETGADKDKPFVKVQKMPTFRGGDINAFRQWALTQIRRQSQKEGQVMVSFVVERDGSVTNVEVTEGVDPLLDAEAVRVVSSSPRWEPGMQRGQAVRVSLQCPIRFSNNDIKVTTTEIKAGEPMRVIVDGEAAIAGEDDAKPLIILDGEEIDEEQMGWLDMSTVESITVLKDGTAVEVYGSKGVNGVVIITSKGKAAEEE